MKTVALFRYKNDFEAKINFMNNLLKRTCLFYEYVYQTPLLHDSYYDRRPQ